MYSFDLCLFGARSMPNASKKAAERRKDTMDAALLAGQQTDIPMGGQLSAALPREQQRELLNQALMPFYQGYGIAPDDIEALAQALLQDSRFWTQAMRTMRRTQPPSPQQERAIREQIAAWYAEAEAVRQQYPTFDFMREIRNPLFASLISSKNAQTRLSLKAAYEACHVGEMTRQAARNAENNTLSQIRAGAYRPKEGGSGAAAVLPAKIDIARLTRTQRKELERRAERGERITFHD